MKKDYVVKRSAIARYGVFAERDYSKGEYIVEYKGKKMLNSDVNSDENKGNHRYIIELNNKWCLDGNIKNNPAKFINHSCVPNSEYMTTGRRVLIHAIKKIKKGEEITVNYGKEYFDEFLKGICGCPKCSKKSRRK